MVFGCFIGDSFFFVKDTKAAMSWSIHDIHVEALSTHLQIGCEGGLFVV
jgi:hypothetical protein